MDKESEFMLIRAFTLAYMVIFVASALLLRNFEFVYYAIFVSIVILVIQLNYRKLHLTIPLLLLLSFVGFLHFLGGSLYIDSIRLYDMRFANGLLGYDNILHFFGAFSIALLAYNILIPHLDRDFKKHNLLLPFLLVIIAVGMGGLVELMEFGAVVLLNAAATVGNYFNNSVDLFFNTLGSFVSAMLIYYYHHGQLIKVKDN